MVTFSLDDPNLVENFEAVKYLKKNGMKDGKLQELYDEQVRRDHAERLKKIENQIINGNGKKPVGISRAEPSVDD